jgi:IclR family transcriptional regulator, KDG regulon repressor
MSSDPTDDPGNEPKSEYMVRSVIVAWRLLETLASSVVPMRISELSKQLGEPKAKIHRHLATMRHLGIVEQVRGDEKYKVGWKLYQVGQIAFERFDLKTIAEPYMSQLRDEVRQSVALAIPIGVEALFIGNLDYIAAGQPKISTVTGSVVPAGISPLGRIVLAFAHARQQEQVLSRPLKQYTKHTLTKPTEVRARLQQIQAQLYDYGSEELTLGIASIAAPILGAQNQLLGIVSVIGSVQFILNPPAPTQISLVQACAMSISQEFNSTAYDAIAKPLR